MEDSKKNKKYLQNKEKVDSVRFYESLYFSKFVCRFIK